MLVRKRSAVLCSGCPMTDRAEVWFTVHGHFAPDGRTGRAFTDEQGARAFADLAARNAWSDEVRLIRHERLAVSND